MDSTTYCQTELRGKVQIYPPQSGIISDFWRETYEKEAKKYWDIFYKRNMDKFFKDRHYLDKEWGQYFLAPGQLGSSNPLQLAHPSLQTKVVLEMGCGVGNTVFPLLSVYPNIFIYACDFSPRAINLVKGHKEYKESRLHTFVCDMTTQDLTIEIPPASVDLALLVFTLSAVSPEKMPQVLQNIKHVLKPNGFVLIRDYAAGDLAQERLSTKDRMISDNFYVRGDGTRVFYFTEASLMDLFLKEGFLCEEIKVHNKKVVNRLREIVMHRRWIQAAFQLLDISNDNVDKTSPLLSFSSERILKRCSWSAEAVNYKEQHGTSIDMASCTSKQLDQGNNSSSVCYVGDEIDLSEGIAAEIFGSPAFEVMHIEVGSHVFKIKCLSKENQHTYVGTGFMLWESALAFATLLTKNPTVISGRRVLELGSGSAGICSMVATGFADLVVASDGDSSTVDLLQENLEANRGLVGPGKLFTQVLKWGSLEDMDIVMEKVGRIGFDVIIGTDVTYAKDAVPLLFATAKALLKDISYSPLLLLCHVTRQVDETSIINAARQYGLYIKDKWPDESNKCNMSKTSRSIFSQGLDSVFTTCCSIRILCFGLEG